MFLLCLIMAGVLVDHSHCSPYRQSTHVLNSKSLPIADQEVGWRARNGWFQICHQKLHGTVERCVRFQPLTLGALEKTVGLKIQGKGRDVPEGSILEFSFHLEGLH